MSYLGDIALGQTIDFQFNTFRFSTGAPFTLAGTPTLAAYVGNSVTQITAGLTLTVDFDAKTGAHNVRCVASGANGFAAATDVTIVLEAGTVDGVSVANSVVGSFSIENRRSNLTHILGTAVSTPATAGILDVNVKNIDNDAASAAGAVTFPGTIASTTNITAATGVVLSGVTHTGAVIPTVTTLTGHTAQTGDSFARIGATGSGLTSLATPTNITAGTITTVTNLTNLPAITASWLTAAGLATDAAQEIADTVIARTLTESYAADGAAPTLQQLLFLVQQMLTEMSIAGTTMTIKKLDGTTTAATLTLNDATTPTSITRTT